MYENQKWIEEARELALSGNTTELREQLRELDPVDIAQLIEELPRRAKAAVVRMLGKEQAAQVFTYLEGEDVQLIASMAGDGELAEMMEFLPVDDAVDLLEEMPAGVVKRILRNTSRATRETINKFLNYPEDSAGSIMTAEFVELKAGMTVGEAIARVRQRCEERDNLDVCYIIGSRRELMGSVSMKRLLLARDNQLIDELMEEDPVFAETGEDRETTALLLARYDLTALPVVDGEKRLVGVVTVDDAVDVLSEEATKDLEQMAAMLPSETPYLKTGVFSLAKNRILWLLVLMLSAMITGAILTRYEAAFAAMPLLVSFIPMITDTGGNAGSQSSTMVIRGMGLGEIEARDGLKVLWKEARVSLVVGCALAFVNFLRLLITNPGNPMVAATVSIALLFTVVLAKTIGGVLPILAKACKADPAVMAAPLITTVVDACALVVYFSIAQVLLGL